MSVVGGMYVSRVLVVRDTEGHTEQGSNVDEHVRRKARARACMLCHAVLCCHTIFYSLAATTTTKQPTHLLASGGKKSKSIKSWISADQLRLACVCVCVVGGWLEKVGWYDSVV